MVVFLSLAIGAEVPEQLSLVKVLLRPKSDGHTYPGTVPGAEHG